MTTKRAYKLQEFVAHSSAVNCLKIGRKSSRVLVTGGEDFKVNLWAIGKPNAILSLTGHTSGIDSVSFDSSEVLVAAGAASGTIKLWDLEEAKIVRTLTGHRSNCISVDFHPFGEFFASGSLDTNLKIWDIRKKGCIHTYKGHTRGVNAIRFTPDGRWVVSGGEDNTVKLWDLTAGKLLHDFKCHEGQVQCIDFHPHEFLLATGSADKTVKFWDLETFELIGSAGPETSGVRCLTFNPDGRTLLCGLHESLKVFSWEPIRCHDGVEVGWSRLSDLNVHEGKLLGCSYNQNCVGVWVVDITRTEPYAINNVNRLNGRSEPKSSSNLSLQNENNAKANFGGLSVSQTSDPLLKETKTLGRLSVSQNTDVKDPKPLSSTGNGPSTPQRVSSNAGPKANSVSSVAVPNAVVPKRNSVKATSTFNNPIFNKSDVIPVIVPRTNSRHEQDDSRKDFDVAGRAMPLPRTNSRHEQDDSRKEIDVAGRAMPLPRTNSRHEQDDSRKELDVAGRAMPLPRTNSRHEQDDSRKELDVAGRAMPLSRTNSRHEQDDSRKELDVAGRAVPAPLLSKTTDTNRRFPSGRDEVDNSTISILSESRGLKAADMSNIADNRNSLHGIGSIQGASAPQKIVKEERHIGSGKNETETKESTASYKHEDESQGHKISRDGAFPEATRGGRMRSRVDWEKRERANFSRSTFNASPGRAAALDSFPLNNGRGYRRSPDKETVAPTSDEDIIANILQQHDQFINLMQSRSAKLQAVYRYWERHDIKGAVSAMEKMADHAVAADVISILTDKIEVITLDICSCILPVLSSLLESDLDRFLDIAMEMLLKLVRTFGSVIYSTLSATSSVGVNIEAEQRLERCNLCFIELEKVKRCLPALIRKRGSVAKSAQELNLALQEFQ
ncbi:katanin p80 WD40 repeat-containing subunit B1 homolog isoform X1 [Cucurbita maxima]|uniref:Katanin p80 WD40 repeat-containing subunit B1 homolog n=1 Tax=Cucurbita maxima TaxID=3661 RepID=A0A6J1HQR1_CUCMA|nr:katanin p80 WD40 repeat-containing subunit B1 homolog isoform X1 [Cucurbita maxima]XP_022966956.1 katanin p80 WD40 repeat-containing subunit B1 homolog isoform X1 [Cucurbita maxima]